MDKRSVSRCIAVAAHGKRCQQSPFRGSPYCWHHTQSRKIPPPSRPLASASTRIGRAPLTAVPPSHASVPAPVALPVDGARLVELLGAQAATLVAFLEGGGDGAVRLERVDGALRTRTVAARPRQPRRARAEAGAA